MEIDDRHGVPMRLCDRTEQVVPLIDPRPFEQALIPVGAARQVRRLVVRRGEEHDANSG